jgi:signal peptidase I
MAKADKGDGGIVELVETVFWALIIAGVFRTLFFQPFWIPSGSMKDTLLIGDFLFVNKMAYGYSRYSCPFAICPITGRIFATEPERGDVVVFRHPVKNDDMIKRLIGLPGDTVQVKAGIVYINGTASPQVADGTFEETFAAQGPMGDYPRCENSPVGEGGTCTSARARETLPNGVVHDVLNITSEGDVDNTNIFTVPAGEYFFMGDNRDNSMDSRFSQAVGGVGFVPAEYLIGRADRVIFSSAGRALWYVWTWRMDRFFKAVE